MAGFTTAELAALDDLLVLNPAVQMSRFAWLRALPEAPSERNLLALMDRLRFVRDRRLDPGRRDRVHPDRWAQLVREGNVTPSWLASDFNTGRRRAIIAAQLIELGGRLTDAAITMFCRLVPASSCAPGRVAIGAISMLVRRQRACWACFATRCTRSARLTGPARTPSTSSTAASDGTSCCAQ